MRSFHALVVCLTCLLWACINVPEVEFMPERPDSGTSAPTVSLALSRTVTNGDVQVRTSVMGGDPDIVELLVDGVVAAQLPPPSYETRWSTQALDEGPHAFSVRASFGERVYTSDVRTLVVDRTAPKVLSHAPRSGDQEVSVHASIQAVFSEAIDPTTVTTESVVLVVGLSNVAAAVHLSADGTVVMLEPVEPLPVGLDVSVTMAPSVTDMAGNALDVTGLSWQWGIPRHLLYGGAISSGGVEGSNVSAFSFVLDGNGRPVVAFIDGSAPASDGVYVMRWSGLEWEQLGGVLGVSAAESVVKACSLWITPWGEILVAWNSEAVDGGSSIHVYRWSGSSWSLLGSPVTPVVSGAKFTSFGFSVNPQGERYLALLEHAAGLPLSMYAARWDEGRWESLGGAVSLNESYIYSGFSLMLDSLGLPAVTWSAQSGEGGAVDSHARRWDGTHWIAPYPTSGVGAGAVPMVSVLDGADRLVLARPIQDFGAGRVSIVSRYDTAVGWETLGPTIEGSYPGETNATVEVLDFDHEGRLVALLSEPEVAGGPVNHYVRQWDESSWLPMGAPLLSRPGATPVGPAQFLMTGPDQWVLARIEESEGTPSRRHLYVYRPNN